MKPHLTISQEEWEQLEAYLSGTMPEAERRALDERLAAEPSLHEKLDEIRLLSVGIKEAELMNRLHSFHAAPTAKIHELPKRKPVKTYWLAAASVILIAAVGAVFLLRGNGNEKIFTAYFEPDAGLATAMSSSEEYNFNRGMIDYKQGKFREAIDVWRPLLLSKPDNDTLHYFSGVSFLALKQNDSAAFHLRRTYVNNFSPFRSDAAWYLALTMIRQDRNKEAISLLEQTTHPKKDELISRLK